MLCTFLKKIHRFHKLVRGFSSLNLILNLAAVTLTFAFTLTCSRTHVHVYASHLPKLPLAFEASRDSPVNRPPPSQRQNAPSDAKFVDNCFLAKCFKVELERPVRELNLRPKRGQIVRGTLNWTRQTAGLGSPTLGASHEASPGSGTPGDALGVESGEPSL